MKKNFILPCSLLALLMTLPSVARAQSRDTPPVNVMWNPEGLITKDLEIQGDLAVSQLNGSAQEKLWMKFDYYLNFSQTYVFTQTAMKELKPKQYTLDQLNDLTRRHELDNIALVTAFSKQPPLRSLLKMYDDAKRFSNEYSAQVAKGGTTLNIGNYRSYLDTFKNTWKSSIPGSLTADRVLNSIWFAANTPTLVLVPGRKDGKFSELEDPGNVRFGTPDWPSDYLNNARTRILAIKARFAVYTRS